MTGMLGEGCLLGYPDEVERGRRMMIGRRGRKRRRKTWRWSGGWREQQLGGRCYGGGRVSYLFPLGDHFFGSAGR